MEGVQNSGHSFRVFIENCNVEELKEQLRSSELSWVRPLDGGAALMVSESMRNFNITEALLNSEELERAYKRCLFEIISLHLRFVKERLIDDEEYLENKVIFNKIFEAIYYSEQCLRSIIRIKCTRTESYESCMNNETGLFRFTPIDLSKNSCYQNLLLYLLGILYEKDFRRSMGSCYKKKYTEDGHYTHTWEEEMTVKDFIFNNTTKETHYQQWFNLTAAKDNGKHAVEYLMYYTGPEFVDLVRDRHVFSFKNGVYVAKKYNEEADCYEDFFYRYGQKPELSSEIVACKYFDLDFDNFDGEHWSTIDTPCFDAIMEYQGFSPEVKKWLWILIGRNIYDVGELDMWQVIAFLKGQAGSGKSTIVTKVCKNIYEPNDVGVLSNNIEKKFGIAALHEKKMFVAPEIKGDFGLEQAEFQSIVSGEDVQIAVKFKTAQSVLWKVPGMLAGNEVPMYVDNSGSISRRMVVFEFNKKVKNSDTQLGKKLNKEMARIIKKANSAYLEAVTEYGSADVWTKLPSYFRDTRAAMAENTNALQHFLNSGKLEFSDDLYCFEKVFQSAFNEHCKENHLGLPKWASDYYMGPFESLGLEVQRKQRKRYPNVTGGKYRHGSFIVGVDIKNEYDDQNNEFKDPES